MAVPKRRHSRARRDKRRSHDSLDRPAASECRNCRRAKPPHRVCPHCGHYRGRAVLEGTEE